MARPRAFTLIELLVVIAVIALLVGLLLPALGRARNAGRLAVSLSNCRQIMLGVASYRNEQKDRLPMRLSYTNGSGVFAGMDQWSYGGKNTSAFWASPGFSGVFDEPAYTRFLNPYVQPDITIEPPAGYAGFTGTGSNMRLIKGLLTQAERDTLQMPVFRSPGDRRTHQQTAYGGDPAVSCYDDVGTSYLMNLRWLYAITGGNFVTQPAFYEGERRCRLAETFDPRFVFIHDQTGDLVAGSDFNVQPVSARRSWMGEFGDKNKSVMGFMDGRAQYLLMTPGEERGDRYTLHFEP